MKEEAVVLAMGTDEKFAQRPLVMGGLLQATPWLGTLKLLIHHPRGATLQEGSGPTQMRNGFIRPKPPPWEVPKRRKTRGNKIDYIYDLTGEELIYMNGGKVTTENKFDLLDEDPSTINPSRKKKEDEPWKSLKSSEGTYVGTRYSKNILYPTYDSFMRSRGDFDYDDKEISFMYVNKYNFCSGYFPEFITLDDKVAYNFSKMNNDSNYYYLYTNNNKYLKQLSNYKSKYDGKYFKKMYFAYKVSKKLSWNYDTGKGVVSFKDSYLCKKGRTQALGETGISIPKDLGRKE